MAEKITKQEAVRRALAHFGNDVPLKQMQGWIKDQMGIEMTEKHISTAKGEILRKAAAPKAAAPKAAAQKAAQKAAPKGPAKKPAAKQPASTTPAGPKPVAVTKKEGIPLDDILYIKELVGRVGPGQLHTLIDAFAK